MSGTQNTRIYPKDIFIAAATTCGIVASGIYFPILIPCCAFPVLLLTYEKNAVSAAFCTLLTVFSLCLFLSADFVFFYTLGFALFGITTGNFAKKTNSSVSLLAFAVIFSVCCKLLSTLLYYRLTGVNMLIPPGTEEMLANFATTWQGGSGAALSIDSAEFRQKTLDTFALFLPVGIFLGAAIEALACLYTASAVHKFRTGERMFALPAFSAWSFPKSLFAALLAGFACSLFAGESYVLRQIGANTTLVTGMFFVIQGLSFACFMMERRKIPKLFRVSIIIISLMLWFLMEIFAIIGILDIGFGLRERIKGNE